MEEYLNENYRVKIDDMNITAEEGIIYNLCKNTQFSSGSSGQVRGGG